MAEGMELRVGAIIAPSPVPTLFIIAAVVAFLPRLPIITQRNGQSIHRTRLTKRSQ